MLAYLDGCEESGGITGDDAAVSTKRDATVMKPDGRQRKRRVLQLRWSYPGLVDTCNQYSAALAADQSYDVTVAYLVGKTDDRVRDRTVAHRVLFFDFTRSQLSGIMLSAVRRLLKVLRRERFDVVLCHRYKATKLMVLAAFFFPIPKLFSVVHHLYGMRHFERRLLVSYCCRKKMTLIAVSDAVKRNLLNTQWGLSPHRVVTIPEGLAVEEVAKSQLIREQARNILGVSCEAFVFGTIGRLVNEKGYRYLISAAALLKGQLDNFRIVIIGDGELRDKLTKQADQDGVAEFVRFIGYVPEAYHLLSGFDAFVMPSISEAFGRVLLEAMAVKLPIIASSVGGIPEVLGDDANLVPPGQPGPLARQMRRYYTFSEEERRNRGEDLHARLLSRFSAQHVQGLIRAVVGTA